MRIAGLFLILVFFACKTKQPLLMSDKVTPEEKEQLSSFFIPILLSKTELEKTINNRVDGTIFKHKITEGNLQIVVEKVDSIRIAIKDTIILYRIPLHILIKKELLLTNLEAAGDIALDFQTNYTLNPDWTITTRTELADYKWLKEPKAKVLGLKVPVTTIAERVLNFSAQKVTDAIDKQVNESLALKEMALQAWHLLQQPILVSEQYNSRFKFTPNALAISPFKTKKDTIISTLFVQGMTQVGVGEQTNFPKDVPLLPLKIEDFGPDNKLAINLISEIPFKEAATIARNNFKGEAYGFGKKKVTIEDIQLTKEGDLLAIRVLTSGDYSGWLLLKGIPSYNQKKNQLEIKDIEFSLDTKNFLLKSAKWLFNGLLTNKLEGSMIYPLKDDLALLKKQLQTQLSNYKIQEGIFLTGKVAQITVKKAYLDTTALMLGVQLDGEVKILIEAIPE